MCTQKMRCINSFKSFSRYITERNEKWTRNLIYCLFRMISTLIQVVCSVSSWSEIKFQTWSGDVPTRRFGMPFRVCACLTNQMLAVLWVVWVDEPMYPIPLESAMVLSARGRYDMEWTKVVMMFFMTKSSLQYTERRHNYANVILIELLTEKNVFTA